MWIQSLLSLALALLLPAVPIQEGRADLAGAYEQAFAAQDEAALRALWSEHPGQILAIFDRDLEASLAAWEASPEAPDVARIAELQARALWSARIASAVTGRPIFSDYASAFAGWTASEKASFRRGQAAFGEAIGALRAGKAEEALLAASTCRELALPLGDWWGSAMGLGAEAQALAALGRHAEALTAASQARLLNHQLGLAGSELGDLQVMLRSARELGRLERARAAAADALALARAQGAADAVAALEQDVAGLEGELAK